MKRVFTSGGFICFVFSIFFCVNLLASSNIDLTRGNSTKKTGVYESALTYLSKSDRLLDRVYELESSFKSRQDEISKKLAEFNLEIGFERGSLDGALGVVESELEAERERSRGLPETERDILRNIEDKKARLEGLKSNILLIGKVADFVGNLSREASEQATIARSFEGKLKLLINEIRAEINDEEARQMLGKIEVHIENINNSVTYIEGGLKSALEKKTKEFEELISGARKTVEQLKKEGVELIKKAEDEELREQEKTEAEIEKLKREKTKQKKEAEQKVGFFYKIYSYTKGIFSGAYNFLKSFFVSSDSGGGQESKGDLKKSKKEKSEKKEGKREEGKIEKGGLQGSNEQKKAG